MALPAGITPEIFSTIAKIEPALGRLVGMYGADRGWELWEAGNPQGAAKYLPGRARPLNPTEPFTSVGKPAPVGAPPPLARPLPSAQTTPIQPGPLGNPKSFSPMGEPQSWLGQTSTPKATTTAPPPVKPSPFGNAGVEVGQPKSYSIPKTSMGGKIGGGLGMAGLALAGLGVLDWLTPDSSGIGNIIHNTNKTLNDNPVEEYNQYAQTGGRQSYGEWLKAKKPTKASEKATSSKPRSSLDQKGLDQLTSAIQKSSKVDAIVEELTKTVEPQSPYEVIAGRNVPVLGTDENGNKLYDWANSWPVEVNKPDVLTEYQRQSLDLQRQGQAPRTYQTYQSPYDDPSTSMVEGTWNPNTGEWLAPSGYTNPSDKARMDYDNAVLAQRQFEFQTQQVQEQQNYLNNLRAQGPTSWIEYSLASGQQPVVQPWMTPLMGQNQGVDVGTPIPGFTPTAPTGGQTGSAAGLTGGSSGSGLLSSAQMNSLKSQEELNTKMGGRIDYTPLNNDLAGYALARQSGFNGDYNSWMNQTSAFRDPFYQQAGVGAAFGVPPAPVTPSATNEDVTSLPGGTPPQPVNPETNITDEQELERQRAKQAGNNELLGFANGGIAWGPTNAIIGEKGPEMVMPLDQWFGTKPAQTQGGYELNNPSLQYLRRMSPSMVGQYQSYQKAQSGRTPEDLNWLMTATAPPSGQNAGLRYAR